MRKYIPLLLLALSACSRKTPNIIYQDRVVTSFDTITVTSKQTDTIPCDDFNYKLVQNTDTVYVSVVKNQIKVKTIIKRDTVIRTEIVTVPRKIVTKIDNSITAKKGSIVGNDNTMTTKKTSWWWIFVAGMLTWFIIQNVIWKTVKRYIAW